jgi:hypothetical protein
MGDCRTSFVRDTRSASVASQRNGDPDVAGAFDSRRSGTLSSAATGGTTMHARRRSLLGCVAATVLIAATAAVVVAADLPAELTRALETSRYVYIATARKTGGYGAPAEIWFMYDQGAVWVASPPTTWRVKRIRAGRRTARIAVGAKDGPSFTATGSLVRDPAVYERLFATFAKKYPEGWRQYESRFRAGLNDGSRVLIRYAPATPGASVSPASESPRPSPGR